MDRRQEPRHEPALLAVMDQRIADAWRAAANQHHGVSHARDSAEASARAQYDVIRQPDLTMHILRAWLLDPEKLPFHPMREPNYDMGSALARDIPVDRNDIDEGMVEFINPQYDISVSRCMALSKLANGFIAERGHITARCLASCIESGLLSTVSALPPHITVSGTTSHMNDAFRSLDTAIRQQEIPREYHGEDRLYPIVANLIAQVDPSIMQDRHDGWPPTWSRLIDARIPCSAIIDLRDINVYDMPLFVTSERLTEKTLHTSPMTLSSGAWRPLCATISTWPDKDCRRVLHTRTNGPLEQPGDPLEAACLQVLADRGDLSVCEHMGSWLHRLHVRKPGIPSQTHCIPAINIRKTHAYLLRQRPELQHDWIMHANPTDIKQQYEHIGCNDAVSSSLISRMASTCMHNDDMLVCADAAIHVAVSTTQRIAAGIAHDIMTSYTGKTQAPLRYIPDATRLAIAGTPLTAFAMRCTMDNTTDTRGASCASYARTVLSWLSRGNSTNET